MSPVLQLTIVVMTTCQHVTSPRLVPEDHHVLAVTGFVKAPEEVESGQISSQILSPNVRVSLFPVVFAITVT